MSRVYLVIFAILFLLCLPQPVAAQSPPTLTDFWNGTAEWKYRNKIIEGEIASWSQPYTPFTGAGHDSGVHLEIINGIWYLFSRQIDFNYPLKNTTCLDRIGGVGIAVRRSFDQGLTWTAPVRIIAPNPSSTAETCAVTDGDVFYDNSANRWYYLYQCLGAQGPWNGCLATLDGSDPRFPFTSVSDNPVITSREIWSQICDPGDDCYQQSGGNNVFDEGTFDIIEKKDGFFFVSFHGFDGVRTYRGIAKTTDFRTWIADDPSQGVPSDAILDLNDALPWREQWQSGGPVGFSAGRTFKEGNYYYQVIEAMDINLLCTPGQNWDHGMFRATSLTSTTWEQLPFRNGLYPTRNPLFYSSKDTDWGGQSPPCSPEYIGMFKDPATNKYYLHFSRLSSANNYYHTGIFFYELVPKTNLLENSDFSLCSVDPDWKRLSPGSSLTNYITYRLPNGSTDSNCYLAANCGAASCTPGQSIYQDINLPQIPPARVSFGGRFATDSGTGTIQLALHEMDASLHILKTHILPVSATTTYQLFEQAVDLRTDTRILRYEMYLSSPNTFRIDETFVEPVTTSPSPSPSPTPSPTTAQLKTLLTNYLSVSDNNPFYYVDNKVNMVDAAKMMQLMD